VPEVPPRAIGYVHPSNEIHVVSVDAKTAVPKTVDVCPGQDNIHCATGNDFFAAKVADHKGPYFHPDVLLAHSGCSA
jgi:hypothetical protein